MSMAPQRDSVEFSSGLFLGAVVGAGLALLVAPDRTPRARLFRRLRKPRQRVARRARKVRASAGATANRSARLGEELCSFASELLRATGEELVQKRVRDLSWLPSRQTGPGHRLRKASDRLRDLRGKLGSGAP